MEEPGFFVPEYIREIVPYVPGKPIEEVERELGITGSVKLASNENPLGPSPKAVDALQKALLDLNMYPDGGGFYLRRKLAENHGFDPDQVILGNGSCEILEILVRTLVSPGDNVVMAWPAFIIYLIATRTVNGEVRRVPVSPDMTHDLEAMAAAIDRRTRVVFVANPNNPTGTMVTQAEVDAFMAKVPENVVVVFDEAYREYIHRPDFPDTLEYIRQGRLVLVTRTFSKIFGLAGTRIGYGIGPEDLFLYLNKVRSPFNTSSLGQLAAMAAVDDTEHVERSVEVNEAGKEQLYQGFERLGLSYTPTEANFILIDLGMDVMEAHEFLMRQGMILRPMKGYGLPNSMRATIGTREQNERMLTALESLLQRG